MSAPIARTWLALVQDESRRIALHPAYVVGLAAVSLPWLISLLTQKGPEFPSLTNASWEVQLPFLLTALGTMCAAALTGARVHRHGVLQSVTALPMPLWAQVAAQFAAVIPAAILTGVLALTELLVAASSASAVGAILPADVATVAAVTLLAGCLGVAAAHIAKNLGAAIGVAIIAGVAAMAGLLSSRPWRWLLPIAPENPFDIPAAPAPLVDRPADWHVLWLVALCIVVVGVALAVRGLRRRVALPGVAIAAAVAVLAAAGQVSTDPLQEGAAWQAAFDDPSGMQVCIERSGDTYCVLPGFDSRVSPWSTIVQQQRRAAPLDTGPITVRQRLSQPSTDGVAFPYPATWAEQDRAAGTPGALSVSSRWAGPGDDSYSQTTVLAFALSVANHLVTDDALEIPPSGTGVVQLCGGRGITTLWLAAGTNDAGRSAFAVVSAHGNGVDVPLADSGLSLIPGVRETDVVRSLLAQPTDEVTATIARHWTTLTAPETSVDEAAVLLGVLTPPPLGPDFGLCADVP